MVDKSNLELLEGMKATLNELIDRRGNRHLIPLLIEVQAGIDEIQTLKNTLDALIADDLMQMGLDDSDWAAELEMDRIDRANGEGMYETS